jgi:hypothetical protein
MTETQKQVHDLQVKLLALLRPLHRGSVIRYGAITRRRDARAEVAEIRRQIHALDPKACLYLSWGE